MIEITIENEGKTALVRYQEKDKPEKFFHLRVDVVHEVYESKGLSIRQYFKELLSGLPDVSPKMRAELKVKLSDFFFMQFENN